MKQLARNLTLGFMLSILFVCPQYLSAQTDSESADVVELVAKVPVEREITGGLSHLYQVRLKAGERMLALVEQRGIDLRVAVLAPDSRLIKDVNNAWGEYGTETVRFRTEQDGLHSLRVYPRQSQSGRRQYTIRLEEVMSESQYRNRIDTLTRWTSERAIPLATVEAGRPFRDLMPLKRILREVKIVALGESTHGTREFFQLKHRMFEFLVREMGFTVFAIEASYAASHNINEYVLYGRGDPAQALASQKFWTWDTEEVAAMIEWMRAYNQTVPDTRKVKFFGFDIQHNEQAMDVVLAYLQKVAPEKSDAARAAFERFRPNSKLLKLNGAEKAQTFTALNELVGFLSLNRIKFVHESSAAEYDRALFHARVLAQYFDVYDEIGDAPRDAYMADNFERLLDAEPHGTRAVIWAHNGHIAFRMPAQMGYHLRRRYRNEYYALALTFNRGAFQARKSGEPGQPPGSLAEFTVAAAPEDSHEWFLARPSLGIYILDFRQAKGNEAVDHWLSTPYPMWSIGSLFSSKWPTYQAMAMSVLRDNYDGVAFVEQTTRARPNPTGVR